MALNIMVVDDSSLTRKAISRIINMTDLDVGEIIEAEDGIKALDALSQSDIDLVLSDLNMPEMCGSELIDRMKSNDATKSIPVVVITTESQTTRIKQLLAEGVKGHLHKPFTPEEFRDMVEALWIEPTTITDDALTKALSQALETMAFLTIAPIEDGLPTPQRPILTEICFTGAISGTIQIVADIDFGKILAENISCLVDINDKDASDALKELANVTCGLFLPMMVSSTADLFDVSVPTVNPSSAVFNTNSELLNWHDFTAGEDCCVHNIEGDLVAVKLILEE